MRHAELRGHLRPGEPHRLLDDDLGDLGQIVADAHQRNPAGQIGHRHAEDGRALELPQHLDLALGLVVGQVREPRRHLGLEFGARRRQSARGVVQQFVEQQRMRGDLRGQEFPQRGELHQLRRTCVFSLSSAK